MKTARYISMIVFLFAFFILGFFQTIVFRQYAYEATMIYARQMLGLGSADGEQRLGRICSQLGRHQCAQDMYRRLQELRPNSLDDMANLAVALTNGQKWTEALPYYQAYVAGGGVAEDVVRWYALALTKTGSAEQAIPWYYRAFSVDVNNREVAVELLDALKKAGRTDEALSLREQIADLKHFSAVELKTIDTEREPAAVAGESGDGATKNEYYFPSLDGKIFFLPFRYREKNSEFILADPDRKSSVINEVDLARWGLAPRVNGAGHVLVKELKIGELIIHNAEMEVCDECKTMIGADILAKAAGRVDTRNKIALLILTDSE
jgi:tetratricopeptide (TPR) repeat protein